ncbi:hypothetical protein ACVWYO_001310 [Sphingomonas sp. UYP23]
MGSRRAVPDAIYENILRRPLSGRADWLWYLEPLGRIIQLGGKVRIGEKFGEARSTILIYIRKCLEALVTPTRAVTNFENPQKNAVLGYGGTPPLYPSAVQPLYLPGAPRLRRGPIPRRVFRIAS